MYGTTHVTLIKKKGRKRRDFTARVHVTLTLEQKAWLEQQDEDQSEVMRHLLVKEMARRQALAQASPAEVPQ